MRLCFLCSSVAEGLPVERSFLLQLRLQEGCLGVGMQAPLCSGHVSTGLQAHSGEGAGCRHTHGIDRYGHQERRYQV